MRNLLRPPRLFPALFGDFIGVRGMMLLPRLIRTVGFAAAALVSALVTNAHAGPPAVNVSSVSPGMGSLAGGTGVTINGSGFFGGGSSSVVTGVTIDGVPLTSVTVVSDTQITGVTGSDAAVGTPTVTAVSPNSGPTSGGSTVTITGTNFGRASDVVVTTTTSSGTKAGGYVYDAITAITIGGSAAPTSGSIFAVNNSTTLTVVTPAGIAGIADWPAPGLVDSVLS